MNTRRISPLLLTAAMTLPSFFYYIAFAAPFLGMLCGWVYSKIMIWRGITVALEKGKVIRLRLIRKIALSPDTRRFRFALPVICVAV